MTTKAQLRAFSDAYRDGHYIADAAAIAGISVRTAHRLIDELGLPRRRTNPPPKPCATCGKLITHRRRKSATYCSIDCRKNIRLNGPSETYDAVTDAIEGTGAR